MAEFDIQRLAIPSVCLLISFLAFTSQLLFLYLEPGPLTNPEVLKFNILIACLWVCYAKACRTEPGSVPSGWTPQQPYGDEESRGGDGNKQQETGHGVAARRRICHRCRVLKPPRAHHCRVCGRCVPKMDHHCPWTGNCVSHFTFPHFVRFLFYAVASMCYLEYFIFVRSGVLWANRAMPSYLGPSMGQLVHLFVLVLLNSFTLFMLVVMLIRTIWSLGGNVTTIESWEIARHKRLLRRSRVFGGYLDGPDGIKVKIEKQEFPYDIGIWANVKQGMGTANILAWFWPLAAVPTSNGLEFELNGFEHPSRTWPPPDPDRIPRLRRPSAPNQQQTQLSNADEISAFKQRQQDDLSRRKPGVASTPIRRRPFGVRHSSAPHPAEPQIIGDQDRPSRHVDSSQSSESGEEAWRSPEGDRLRDYGVDEHVEFYDQDNDHGRDGDGCNDNDDDDDDVPLSELIRRRQLQKEHVS